MGKNTRGAGEEMGGADRQSGFEAVFRSAPVPMAVTRLSDRRLIEVNEAACQMLGYGRDELLGRTPDEIGHLVDTAAAGERARIIEQGRLVLDQEAAFRQKSGELRWGLISASAIDFRGERCWLSIVTDITASHAARAADEARRVSEERYHRLIEQTADGVLLLQGDIILDTNPAMAELLGRSVDELIGTSWLSYVEPANLAELPFQRPRLQNREPLVFERRVLRPDGSVAELELHARQIAPDLMLGTVRDVGPRKAAERERAHLLRAIDQSADTITIVDETGKVIYVNPARERSLGLTRDQMIGRNFREIQVEGDNWTFDEALRTARAQGSWSGEQVSRRPDGSPLRESITVTAVRDPSGAVVNYVAIRRDITRERDLEEQLRQSQKMEAVGRLAGGVAHDFNNLLTAINGFTELAYAEAEPGSEMAEFLAEIKRSADRASALTRQLLAFGRRAVLSPQVVDPNTVVVEIAPMLRRIIGEDVRLEVATDGTLGRVLADRGQLEQVIVNLAANARDAMPTGGTMTISTARTVLGDEYVAVHPDARPGEYVRLGIADTGVGMDSRVIEHIFEPFFTTKAPGSGTGLGLATVFGIVRQSGGYISVQSDPGKGSTFFIDLPAIDELVPDEEVPKPASAHVRDGSGRATILVVEDEPAVLGFATQLLEHNGYTVLPAANGDEAVEIARRYHGQIDLLFSDMVMPGLTGPETASAVKLNRPQIRQLFASGYSEEMVSDHEAERRLPFVAKPYAADTLLRAIQEVLVRQ